MNIARAVLVAVIAIPYAFLLVVVIVRLVRAPAPPGPGEGTPPRRTPWDVPVDDGDDESERYYSSREYPWT